MGGGLSPVALYRSLLTSSVPASQVPRGISLGRPTKFPSSSEAKKRHQIGAAQISINGGPDVIVYSVYPNRQDVLAAWEHALKNTSQVISRLPGPSWAPKPSDIQNGYVTFPSAPGKTTKLAITTVGFADGNVLVSVSIVSEWAARAQDKAPALALAPLALSHLVAVRGGH
jgi:hypothetical protein